MRIGELGQRVSVDPKTIRYYEHIGLLTPPTRTASGYRIYGPDDEQRLRFVRRAQHLGLSLEAIGEILALRDSGERPCGYVLDVVHGLRADIERRIDELSRLRDDLTSLIGRAERAQHATSARYCGLIERE
jgi:DNA-binding transcriptional MerR regulator